MEYDSSTVVFLINGETRPSPSVVFYWAAVLPVTEKKEAKIVRWPTNTRGNKPCDPILLSHFPVSGIQVWQPCPHFTLQCARISSQGRAGSKWIHNFFQELNCFPTLIQGLLY